MLPIIKEITMSEIETCNQCGSFVFDSKAEKCVRCGTVRQTYVRKEGVREEKEYSFVKLKQEAERFLKQVSPGNDIGYRIDLRKDMRMYRFVVDTMARFHLSIIENNTCPHEPVIDTGVGYYLCQACQKSWKYTELIK